MKKQKIIVADDSRDFEVSLDVAFGDGYKITPGTVAIAGVFPNFRYFAIVEKDNEAIMKGILEKSLTKKAVKKY